MWLGHDSFAFADNSAAGRDDRLSISRIVNLQRAIGALAEMAAEVHAASGSDSPDAGDSERAAS